MPDRAPPTAPSQIAELKVSGHMMALEPGIYCVFTAPGSPLPDAQTGLPTVRISPAPGPEAGQVEVAGLSAQGWVGPDSATLVRVGQMRANVLVTVYQAPGATANAPQLQFVRVGGLDVPAVAAVEAPATGRAAKAGAAKVMEVVSHIYGRGDVGSMLGETAGEPGSKRWIEGFGIAPAADVPVSDIEYQAVLGRGWLSPWSEGGQFCGSRGMSLPILGLRVRLRGASAESKRVRLSATFVDGSTVGPVGDGEPCEAESMAALESFTLAIEDAVPAAAPRGKVAPGKRAAPAKRSEPAAEPRPTAKRGGRAGAKPSGGPSPAPTRRR